MLYKQLNIRLCAGFLAFMMLFWNIPLTALATDITGVEGNNGVYNIEAAKVSGSTGFRQYNNFELSQGDIENEIGDINITNNTKDLTVQSEIIAHRGNIDIKNIGDNDLNITKDSNITAEDGNITISNTNGNSIIEGLIQAQNGDVTVNQTNGSILRNIIDATLAYKTLIKSSGNVTLNVVNGDIGSANNVSIESINIDAQGSIVAHALNDGNGTGSRLINIRAINSNGNNVTFNTLYADNVYVNAPKTNLTINDALISNYAQLNNKNKLGIVDNINKFLYKNADIQLYTAKTCSFDLGLGDTINMKTNAPIVYNNPHMLVNGYHSEQSFVNLTQKESKDRSDRLDMANVSARYNNEVQKGLTLHFNTINDKGLSSNYKIYDILTTGALIQNDGNLKLGNTTTINIKFDDVDINVKANVVNIDGNMANIEFKDLPKDVANLILYRYMQQKNSMKISTNE